MLSDNAASFLSTMASLKGDKTVNEQRQRATGLPRYPGQS
jgi:hypothetical protein